MENSKKLIQLSKNDNVLVVCQNVAIGDKLQHGHNEYVVNRAISIGHKIASRNIIEGESIRKFNVVIGSATMDIKKGEHVHLHNMKSDFIPTYTIEDQDKKFK